MTIGPLTTLPLLSDDAEATTFEGYFRDPALASEMAQAWVLEQRADLLDALRGLFSGGAAPSRLRLWVFLELAGQSQGRMQRDDLVQWFYALRPDALEMVLKRLRELGLLVWDATSQDYHLSALAQQVVAVLAPLTRVDGADDDMAGLLTQVAGAQALGLSDSSQIRHLHAQLARLYDAFAEAIASGSEARLREAQPRFERALELVDRAGEALTALIRNEHDDARLEREARALGHGQAKLLAMASQFTRALQQADRQRVTLGSTGVTSSDVRQWLQTHPALETLLGDALAIGVRPVFVSEHDLLDVAESEFERERGELRSAADLPPPVFAETGKLETLRMPVELGALIDGLASRYPVDDAGAASEEGAAAVPLEHVVLGGRFAQAAYRLQLLPLLGDAQAITLQGQTGDLARSPWRAELLPAVKHVNDPEVACMSQGSLLAEPRPDPAQTAMVNPSSSPLSSGGLPELTDPTT